MKSLLTILTLILTSVSYAGLPVEVLTPVDGIYVPRGFDSNDDSEVILSGYLPNLCHKSPRSAMVQNGDTLEITVTSLKYDKTNPYCPEMVVPFVERVSLGVLPKGIYNIVVNGKSVLEKKSKILIEKAQSNDIDSNVYANVHNVMAAQGSDSVTLSGYTPSDCFVLDDVKFVSNGTNTYSVLPLMKQVNDFCPRKMVAFSKEVQLPHTLKRKKLLLHVRVMNGKSLNTIYSK
jgi:hypothetical protein